MDVKEDRETWIMHLTPELLWDVDSASIDPEKHIRWLLERVLERGQWEDWILVRDHLGETRILKELPRLRLDPKTLNFLEKCVCLS